MTMFRNILSTFAAGCDAVSRGFESFGYVMDAAAVRAQQFSSNQRGVAAISELESIDRVAKRLAAHNKSGVTKAQRDEAEKLISNFGT
jgi:hypothetical protein